MGHVSEEFAQGHCAAFQSAIELIGRRWTGAILVAMLAGATRFSEIRGSVPGLSDRLLSDRLRELEAAGLVARDVLPEVPVQVRYSLTGKADDLMPIVRALADWAERWEPAGAGARS